MITKINLMNAFETACKKHGHDIFVNLPEALVYARNLLADRRYKVFALAGHGNGHGDSGGLIQCAGIKLWWHVSGTQDCTIQDKDENGNWIGTCHVEKRPVIEFEDYKGW